MGIELNKFFDPAQLVSKAEHNADITALIHLDMIHQLNENVPCQLVDILILAERG